MVWRGDATLPTEDQGVTILGTRTSGLRGTVVARRSQESMTLSLIGWWQFHLQCAWLLLLLCASTRVNFVCWVVELSHGFAARHDSRVVHSDPPVGCALMMSSPHFNLGGRHFHGANVCQRRLSAPEWEISPEDCVLDNEDLMRPQGQEHHGMGGNGLRRKKQTPPSEEWCGQD